MNLHEYFAELCRRMGWEPTLWRIAVFEEWARREGIVVGEGLRRLDFHWNPLATTWLEGRSDKDIGYGPGKWNNANPPHGVGIYASADAGIEATRLTLINARYENIRRCFKDQNGYQAAIGPLDFTSWVGSASYGADMVNFMNTTQASKTALYGGPDAPPPAPVSAARLNEVLVQRFTVFAVASDTSPEGVALLQTVYDFIKEQKGETE